MKRVLISIAVFLVVAILPVAVIAQSLTWYTDQPIYSNSHDSGSPSVAISGSNAVAVWKQSTDGHDRVYASYSTDKGATWSVPVIIDFNVLNAADPKVAISGSNVVAVFHQWDGVRYRIYANYSTNGGQTWGGARLIEDNAGNNGYEPQVVISGSNVVAIWKQYDGSRDRIYANHSSDGGQTWGADTIIDSRPYEARMPNLAISGSNVVAVWSQYDGAHYRIFSRYSTDGGASWAGTEDQGIENTNQDGAYPRIAVSGNNVVAIWTIWDTVANIARVYTNRAAFSGGALTWTASNCQLIQNNDALDADAPQIAISGDNVVAVWIAYEDATGVYHLYTSYSSNAGADWIASQLLVADDTISGGNPQVAISGGNVVAVWNQDDSVGRIYARHSFDGGSSWEDVELIEDNDGENAHSPRLVISGNDVVAVWCQMAGGNYGIFSNYALFASVATGSGGGCFIATAAFGTSLARQVEILRQFRDRYLMTSFLGKKFVAWYYKNGPALADYIQDKPVLKAAVRMALYPLIGISFLLISGLMPFAMMGLLLSVVLYLRLRPQKLNT